jgi:S-adenosyl-L-methionine hydrolase (adenosine-forming)
VTPRHDTISFLSDFGSDDELVGVVKAVLRGLAPHLAVVDLTHGIPPFDVRAGGLALARAAQYLPAGLVLAVVDPGVGTDRRAVAIEAAEGGMVFLGPDNGLLASAVAMLGGAERAVAITNPDLQLVTPGATFAARDVFAPAAAHLANGGELTDLGPVVDVFSLLPGVLPVAERKGDEVESEVLWVDRFGNAQLNVGPDDLEGMGQLLAIRFHESVRTARLAPTYGAIGGGVGLVIDSYGLVSVCLDRQSAAAELGLDVGDRVLLLPAEDRAPAVPVTMRTSAR